MSQSYGEGSSLTADSSITISIDIPSHTASLRDSNMAQDAVIEEPHPTALQTTTPSHATSSVNDAPPSNPKMSRKRTKTGCLTCRRRRIKCGEERPICNNCVKSKRNCEGYTQRVVFKHPVGTFRHAGLPMQDPNFPPHLQMPLGSGYAPPYPQSTNQAGMPQLLPIAPRPLYPAITPNSESILPPGYDMAGHMSPSVPVQDQIRFQHQTTAQTAHEGQHGALPNPWAPLNEHRVEDRNIGHYHADAPVSAPSLNLVDRYGITLQRQQDIQSMQGAPASFQPFIHSPYPVKRQSMSALEAVYQNRSSDPSQGSAKSTQLDWSGYTTQGKPHRSTAQVTKEGVHANRYIKREGSFSDTNLNTLNKTGSAEDYLQNHGQLAVLNDTRSLHQPLIALEEPEDDYYDVDSDEEMPADPSTASHNDDLRLILALNSSNEERQVRSFTTFLNHPNVLATYHPSHTASPLMDPKTARIFCHFVTSTGPSLSIFERHSVNPAIMFTGLPVPPAQQALWTYTMPTVALGHQGLMHAMLALGSLHIAKLQSTSTEPSMKHYHYALRRVAKAVGLPQRRKEITTLAATLLLGFYEIMTAEHSKWNSHLAGAKQLVMEIDFAGMTRQMRRLRAVVKARMAQQQHTWNDFGGYGYNASPYLLGGPEDPFPDKDWAVDEDLISQLMGMRVSYDRHHEGFNHLPEQSITTMQDVERYKIRSDLYWWYCKQDVFQSMISGNRLLMPFQHWRHCPPRAQLGRIDAICGTMDHLVLLMARIADFGAKDQRRKRRVMVANGGQWIPPPGFFPSTQGGRAPKVSKPPPGSGQAPSHSAGPSSTSNTDPPMYGMMPPPSAPPQMPAAFATMAANLADTGATKPGVSTSSPGTPVDVDLETETRDAHAEWESIRDAFELFSNSLPPEFHPLPPDAAPAIQTTPFGSALQYRTHTISCIWTFYYAGRILVERMHPAMPPAAMVAAGIAAPKTAKYADTIGKICAGLFYPQQYEYVSLQTHTCMTEVLYVVSEPETTVYDPLFTLGLRLSKCMLTESCSLNLNPGLGSALIESTFSLFFAAVQYRDPGQRGWTISKLRDIAQRTGWQTSSAIAAGCEISWQKMGQAGKGPRYEPTIDHMNSDGRVSGKGRTVETNRADPLMTNNDRRFISVDPNARTHWALGILSVEEDIKNLDLSK